MKRNSILGDEEIQLPDEFEPKEVEPEESTRTPSTEDPNTKVLKDILQYLVELKEELTGIRKNTLAWMN
jgi:hypothetical protein